MLSEKIKDLVYIMRASPYTTLPASADIEMKVTVNFNNYFYLHIAHIQNRCKIFVCVCSGRYEKMMRVWAKFKR
jgi:hypothetical protein